MKPNKKMYENLMADMMARDKQKRDMLIAEVKQKPFERVSVLNMRTDVCVN